MLFPDFRKRAENRLSHGGSIQSAALRKENDNSNLGLLRWCIANEETVRLLRVAGDGRARFPGDVHAAHISCMRHAKGDAVFQSAKDRRVNAQDILAFAKRQLAVAFEQCEWRDRNPAIAERFELQLLEIGRQTDSPAGFLHDKPRGRVEPGSS